MKTPIAGPRVQPRPLETPAAAPAPRNEVKPQPQAVRGEARDVSRFDSGRTQKPAVALSTPVAPSQGTRVAPGTYPSVADVKSIASIQDPVARNYAITQGYSDLSNALGQMLGKENANWSTFATWASKQAGVSIRNEDMPKFFTDALKGAGEMAGPLKKVDDVMRKLGLPALPLADIAAAGNEALTNVSKSIGDGNQFVFNEIGQEFARFIETFQGDTSYDAAKAQKYLDGFAKDKPVLREAFSQYTKAMFEKDPNKKAELMLLGNDQIGLHEQTQLQSHVEKALNSPVKDTFRNILRQAIESGINALPFPAKLVGKAALKTGFVDAALNPLVNATATVFRKLATEHMMKLAVPGGALKLGNDLPPPPGMESTLFPPHLRSIENPELRALLGKLDSSADGLKGTASKDWSKLDQRMNYIIDLFRTRQSDPRLFDAPFGKTNTTYPLPATQQRAG